MVKGLKGEAVRGAAEVTCLFSLEETEGGLHCSPQLPCEGKRMGKYQSFLCGDQQKDPRERHEAVSQI